MPINKTLENQKIKDFLSLFFSNIFEKLLGLFRELVIAFFLGSSIVYANFLVIRIISDFFSQFTSGNALKASLLPKFTKLYQKNHELSLKKIFVFSKKTSIYLFLTTQIVQTLLIFYLGLNNQLLYYFISAVLSLSISFNFISFLFLTILQAKGKFYKFSYISIINSFVYTILSYPLIYLFSVLGLAISRLVGIIVMFISMSLPMSKDSNGNLLEIEKSDFNISTLILGNFVNILLISSRFIAGADGSNSITHFMYAVIILNTLFTSVIGNISTISLRTLSINRKSGIITISLLISAFLGALMIVVFYFFGNNIIDFIYVRGAFNKVDSIFTSNYLYKLSYSFTFLFFSTILFQPFLSLSINETKKERFYFALLFVLSIITSSIYVLSLSISTINKTIIVMTFSSIVCVLLSIFSYMKYLRHEN